MLYCDYAAYLQHGGLMSDSDFSVWASRASRKIDQLTYGRAAAAVAAHPELAEPLADACTQMADLMRQASSGMAMAARGVVSATTDGYSESYAAGGMAAALTRSCRAVLADALGSDPYNLLYAGVCGC